MAPNGFLHAATVIARAVHGCGYGKVANLPQGASGHTAIELKANFLRTLREGTLYRRAQMILWPKAWTPGLRAAPEACFNRCWSD